MKPNKDYWTDVVRRTLSEAEESLPQDGWERLERELNPVQPVMTKVPSYRIWMKFAAAAAAVLVCVSIGVRVLRSDKNVLKRVVMVSEAAVSEQNTDAGEAIAAASGHTTALPEPLAQVVRPVLREVVREMAAIPPSQTELSAEVFVVQDAAAEPALAAAGPESPVAEQHAARTAEPRYTTADYDGLFASAEPVRRRHKTDVGVFASGVVTASGSSGINNYSMQLISHNAGVASLRLPYNEYTYRHKQPLGLGLTFRKDLGLGFSAETGATYTLLRSEVVVPGAVTDVKQKLHFVGIPLRVNWDFLRRGGFSLYVGAGVKAEMCVGARFGDEKIRENEIQWSLSGVVGVQYKLGKTVGIYFEPEVSHYLTHTSLQTSYTDSPVALNLRLGLRFNY